MAHCQQIRQLRRRVLKMLLLASLLSALPHAAIDVTVPLERIQEAEERAVLREQARSQVEQVRADLARARAEYHSASDLARLLRPVEHAPVLAASPAQQPQQLLAQQPQPHTHQQPEQPPPQPRLATQLMDYEPQRQPPQPEYSWTMQGIQMWARANGPTYAAAGAPRTGSALTGPVRWGWAAAGVSAEELLARGYVYIEPRVEAGESRALQA